MCLRCDDGDHSYHDDPGHDSFNIPDCTGNAATCTATDHTPWFKRRDLDTLQGRNDAPRSR